MNRRTFLQAAGLGVVGAGVGMTRYGWPFHKSDLPTIQPSYGDIENIQILGYNDMSFPPGSGRTGNWDQTYEFRVLDTPRGDLHTAAMVPMGGASSMSQIQGRCTWSTGIRTRRFPTIPSTSISRGATFWW
jgi:hypothetical protein